MHASRWPDLLHAQLPRRELWSPMCQARRAAQRPRKPRRRQRPRGCPAGLQKRATCLWRNQARPLLCRSCRQSRRLPGRVPCTARCARSALHCSADYSRPMQPPAVRTSRGALKLVCSFGTPCRPPLKERPHHPTSCHAYAAGGREAISANAGGLARTLGPIHPALLSVLQDLPEASHFSQMQHCSALPCSALLNELSPQLHARDAMCRVARTWR